MKRSLFPTLLIAIAFTLAVTVSANAQVEDAVAAEAAAVEHHRAGHQAVSA
jgi:hypothetical protein